MWNVQEAGWIKFIKLHEDQFGSFSAQLLLRHMRNRLTYCKVARFTVCCECKVVIMQHGAWHKGNVVTLLQADDK